MRFSLLRTAFNDNGCQQSAAVPNGLFCLADHEQQKMDTQPFGSVCRIEVLYTVALL